MGTQGTARANTFVQDVAPTRGACALESGSVLLIRLHPLIAANLVWRSADLESITSS